ncbi:MAG: glutamate formimidoyltransferase [Saprospiraceae bacterium]|nr:glutamate formimidoyltransferase [Saprospiraceae bacterium]MBP6566364.1 glutamate formimidoyltransferase [Saprospiraceae bacterium]
MNQNQIIECVPNFSEGRDMTIIKQITDEIEKTDGVRLLDVDPGKATNRTVVTFVGHPKAVIEAAYQAIKKAAELIDMSKHSGEHPRMGATDVCPLIPISGISMEETAAFAHQLGKRVGEALHIPVFMYESAATKPERQNLAIIRAGEYEGMAAKLKDPKWYPDYGTNTFNEKAGATVIGARDYLVAYNVNLNTTSVRRANSVAFDVRENGRIKTDARGKNVLDDSGEPIRIPGVCKSVKAIGWYIEEYGIAQISMNLTNIHETPLHIAFDECCKSAQSRGLRVTGSELVGLVPKSVLIDAGKHFLKQQKRSIGVSEKELIHIAVRTLGLDELSPFDPSKKVIEYLMEDKSAHPLVQKTLVDFANETASESPAPGGGSISAYVGVLGVSLGTMVANLSSHKVGWDDKIEYFSEKAEEGQKLKDTLLDLVDADTHAFNKIMDALRMPKATEDEKSARKAAMHAATIRAIEVPLRVMKISLQSMYMLKEMATNGNPNSVSDAGVGALCARTAVEGAALNVRINCSGFDDKEYVADALAQAKEMLQKAKEAEREIISVVEKLIV